MTVSTMRETERDEVIAARGDANKPLLYEAGALEHDV
jgi:hypothetical protein